MNIDPLTMIDFYKADHRRQYPEGTTFVYSNFTPRSTRLAPKIEGVNDKVVFFGLQYLMIWFLQGVFFENFFNVPRDVAIRRYRRRMDTSLGAGAIPTEHIEMLHQLGYLPILIRALPEGTAVPEKVPVLTIENTRPDFFWLTNYLETVLSCMLWKMCTSATTAYKYKQLLNAWAWLTGGPLDFVKFQAHDFSFRGMGGVHDACMSGAAHLTSFVGTDTVGAIDFIENYYLGNAEKELIGCSVPATEHSVMCMSGKDGEFETFKRLITEVYPKGIVSIVSDSFDFWQVITDFLPRLRNEIMARDGKLVIRPDSGDPIKIICGDPGAAFRSPEYYGAVQCLWATFGGKVNAKGYRELDSHIGLIYGDSITIARAQVIAAGLAENGFASTNVVLGVGSYTYTHVTRDTLGFAMKATVGIVNGETRLIIKDPKTDTGMKKSAKGFLSVMFDEKGELYLKDEATPIEMAKSLLTPVFKDGKVLRFQSIAEIRHRIEQSL